MTWLNVVENTVTGLGYELVDCERSSHGLLRVYIDRLPEQAYDLPGDCVTVDDCEKVTRQLQYALEVVNCDYSRLEVSSPGLDRPLRTQAHFERYQGEQIEISLKVPFQGRKKYRGVLEAVPAQQEGEAAGWQLILTPEVDKTSKTANKPPSKTALKKAAAKKAAEPEVEQALGFTLDEIREARLVPVVSFKGRGGREATPTAGGVTVDEAQELGGQKK
ncbi:MAG: ribosome maturation factor RimP [Acidobacteriota bacterium]